MSLQCQRGGAPSGLKGRPARIGQADGAFGLAWDDEAAIRRYHVGFEQICRRRAHLAAEVAVPAGERRPGNAFQEYVEMSAGDFTFVPPFLSHSSNMSTTEELWSLACRTPENIVINLPDIDNALLAAYRRA